MQDEDIRKMLDKLKDLSAYSQDIAFLYDKYSKEHRTLSEFEPPEPELREFKRRLSRVVELAERYRKKYEHLEDAKNLLEKCGVRFLAFVVPHDHEVGIRVVGLEDIRNPFVAGKYYKVNVVDAIEKAGEYEKLGKLAICRPIGYRVYTCKVDDKIIVLDYS